jgi:hypothetical protein
MPVTAFDHYNVRADRPMLDRLRDFYRDVVRLTVGERPGIGVEREQQREKLEDSPAT